MDFIALAQQCAPTVHPQTIAAIVKAESAFREFAIGINKRTAVLKRQPQTKAEAVATAKDLITRGHNIDMGLGQINSDNLPRLGITVDDVFDPCKNLAAAATILTNNYIRAPGEPQEALKKALSAYNTGDFAKGLRNGYVSKVTTANQQIAQGYTVPAIKFTESAAAGSTRQDNSESRGSLVLATTPQQATRAKDPKPAQPQRPADPSMVFGEGGGNSATTNTTPGDENKAAQAMVF
ncbi:lytic transglycosylase domain-containing protein (plasmid) [Acidovorax sp. 210-6]|uniref:lytic transglycosylase domain-containing protein n=1 Tax=Acidovorax sp. 210-6 TaxID=2699468 RepID=UPI001389CBE4|nr:lytic transglycosylase domain-containing protein [Acidovorax sp. 210-6]NCU67966.1 lytic transglycosylase domain-containing protein [Acidovorax sp. 210-6]